MEAYRRNAERVPELNGDIIPEPAMNRAGYEGGVRRRLAVVVHRGAPRP